MNEESIVIFVNVIPQSIAEDLKIYGEKNKKNIKTLLITDGKNINELVSADYTIVDNLKNPYELDKKLSPYRDNLLAITCRGEANIAMFQKIIPYVPYLKTPTVKSLFWATDKISMRKKFRVYDKKITPRFTIVSDYSQETIENIEKKVGFPMVLKPSGLAASLLVTICFNHEELEESIKKILRKIKKIYKENKREIEPSVLVEQFMEGEMYSVDAYVTSRGKIYFCPFVRVKTGREIGFDDFFGYIRTTPTTLKQSTIQKAEEVAKQSIRALGLRSITVHIELMRTDGGWKIIELGPRIGGFRHSMYQLSYGINHSLNDILIRIPQKPIVNKKVIGHTAVLQFFAKNEGTLTNLSGIKKIQKLNSFHEIKINKKIGDKCIFAKHGGKSVFDLTLFNNKRPELLADIRRVEKNIIIKVNKKGKMVSTV